LRQLGFSRVRHFHGGIADWKEAGLPLESEIPVNAAADNNARPAPLRRLSSAAPSRSLREELGGAVVNLADRLSITQVFSIWLGLILVCGAVYWLIGFSGRPALAQGGQRLGTDLGGLWTAIYFSFVTVTSVGYGDVLPLGSTRILAVAEAVSGLLLFGLLIAKFVSYRQDMLVRQIHRVTFEERLDRVQTNLHLVLSELLAIAAVCNDNAMPVERFAPRFESVTLIFAGELRTVHALLYNPQRALDEQVLGAILANLASALNTLGEVLVCLPNTLHRSSTLEGGLRTLSALAEDICAECVPPVYAPALTVWMDRIQQAARTIV
jgi:hypothetical protein